MPEQPQESRVLTVGVKVTATEKRLVDLVLLVHPEVDGASNLLRLRSLPDVLEEGREIETRLRGMTGEAQEPAA